MTPQQLEENSQKLEAQVATLEKELAKVKQILDESSERKQPWWLKIAGSFENDPDFDEAVRVGQEWRKSS